MNHGANWRRLLSNWRLLFKKTIGEKKGVLRKITFVSLTERAPPEQVSCPRRRKPRATRVLITTTLCFSGSMGSDPRGLSRVQSPWEGLVRSCQGPEIPVYPVSADVDGRRKPSDATSVGPTGSRAGWRGPPTKRRGDRKSLTKRLELRGVWSKVAPRPFRG